jgi:hypothetical protein
MQHHHGPLWDRSPQDCCQPTLGNDDAAPRKLLLFLITDRKGQVSVVAGKPAPAVGRSDLPNRRGGADCSGKTGTSPVPLQVAQGVSSRVLPVPPHSSQLVRPIGFRCMTDSDSPPPPTSMRVAMPQRRSQRGNVARLSCRATRPRRLGGRSELIRTGASNARPTKRTNHTTSSDNGTGRNPAGKSHSDWNRDQNPRPSAHREHPHAWLLPVPFDQR